MTQALSFLDIRTVLFVAGISSLFGAVYLFSMRPKAVALRDAFAWFALAVAMMAGGFIWVGLTGVVSESVAGRLLSNLLVSGSTVAIWQACRRVADRPSRPPLALGALALLAALLLPVSLDLSMQPWRHLIGTIWSLCFLTAALRELRALPTTGDRASIRLARTTLGVFCALLAIRIPSILLADPVSVEALREPGLAVAWFNLVFAMVPFALTIVVLAISNGRLTTELATLAGTDDLTGLVSRRLLYERSEQMLAELPRDGCLAVLMIDLDDFKQVNDSHGHAAGDEVLRHVARLLRETLREDSLIVRYGGDEFCALVPVASEAAAFIVGERLRTALASVPCTFTTPPSIVTASIGVTVHRHGSSLRERLAEADRHAYSAKSGGRNLVIGDKT